jgi:predicted NACHT family NTPase
VLVELRYYRTSILDLIQDFLQRHDPNLTVDAETLKTWLRQGQLLLLMDGLNELPIGRGAAGFAQISAGLPEDDADDFHDAGFGGGGRLGYCQEAGNATPE